MKKIKKILVFVLGILIGSSLVTTTLVQAYSNGVDVTPEIKSNNSSKPASENPLSSYKELSTDNQLFFEEETTTLEKSYTEIDKNQAQRMKEEEELMKKVKDVRALYEDYRAPMVGVSEHLVRTAQKHGVDYKLIVAISIVESGGGRKCFRKYNAFGWGQEDYPSFEANLDTVIEGIARNYVADGMDTPEKMAPVYNQANVDHWIDNVNHVMEQL